MKHNYYDQCFMLLHSISEIMLCIFHGSKWIYIYIYIYFSSFFDYLLVRGKIKLLKVVEKFMLL